jgi:hypothetical protein
MQELSHAALYTGDQNQQTTESRWKSDRHDFKENMWVNMDGFIIDYETVADVATYVIELC